MTLSSLIGLDDLYGLGFHGSGVEIAVVDTGINGNHPDLVHGSGSASSFIVKDESFVPAHGYVDQDGHGTFIAGMLIGNGDSSSGAISGLAPQSNLWNLRVLDENGEGEESWTEAALDWIIAQPTKPDILSLSFGSTSTMSSIEGKIKQLWDDGVFVVVAAGNEGPDYFTVDSPGNVLDVMTVGACTSDEYLLSFSSQGPTPGDYYYKPDVVAFGDQVTSLSLTSGYEDGSGTSFAVPFITAGVALLEEATGGAETPDAIKAAILDSCHSIGYSHFMEGAGLPDFDVALALLQDPAWDGVAVLPENVSMPVEDNDATSHATSLDDYMIKPTVILSKNTGTVHVEVEGASSGATTAILEDYSGSGDRQFVVKVQVSKVSPAFGGGTLLVHVKYADDTIAATITVQIAGTGPGIVPFITFIIIVIALAGMILFFAVAYKKGAQAMPRPQCEIDGTCTPIGS